MYSMMHFLLFLFLQTSQIHSAPSQSRLNNATDQHSLLEFKANLVYDPYNSLNDWNPDNNFCSWTGVSCNLRGDRAIALNLASMGLQGSISGFIGNLSFLRSIDLSNNSIQGHIPQDIGRLSGLMVLRLQDNQLEGPIPSTISGCRNLVELNLRGNWLSGGIPAELGSLRRLKLVDAGKNGLTGTIPSSLSNISSLTQLSLRTNNLAGFIPKLLGLLANLEVLYLDENNLMQQIPSSLSNCKSLRILSLSENKLSGGIPSEFGAKLRELQELNVGGNQLSGNIPISLSNCTKLRVLLLQQNRLRGTVPADLGKLLLLERLDLGSNRLTSSTVLPLLTALTNCSFLQKIDLSNNQLSGMLPPSMARLSPKLSYLSLSNNSIEGIIPEQLGNLTNLTFLALDDNLFRGSIPLAFKGLHKLEQLYLGNNWLEGNIPSEIGQMEGLGLLSVHHNMLSGRIPDSLGQLQRLRRLHFHHNQLSGNIPASLGKCQILELFDLSHNRLSGNIPPEVAGLPNLQFYMNLSWNFLQGPLPSELGKIVMAQAIDISSNRLSGNISDALKRCIALEYLNVSRNALHGPIPSGLVGLRNLENLDLSYNMLSGNVSDLLKGLKTLRYIDFSFNNFTEEIPEEGFLKNRTIIALFQGNPGLCGPQIYSLPACPKNHSLPRKVTVPIVIVSAFIFCCLLAGFVWGWYVQRSNFGFFNLSAPEHRRISYRELVAATNGFDEAYLLGIGSFGLVHKGHLMDGTVVAIKAFDLQKDAAHNSFSTECKVLQTLQHRNLIKIISSCSSRHFRGLVLELMSNGSLEKHLYPESNDSNACRLRLTERLNIAIDVAQGMEYLHNNPFMQVVHCDLKPSNILLDGRMKAVVADFSIAELTSTNSSHTFISTLPLRGSIGYIAPEYASSGKASTNGDVYSFGIVLLEMITGKRPTNDMFMDDLTLRNWVKAYFPQRVMKEVVDGTLLTYPNNDGLHTDKLSVSLIEFIRLALQCTNESPRRRPGMTHVVNVLRSIREYLMKLK